MYGVKALLKSVSTHLKNATSILEPFLPLIADLTVLWRYLDRFYTQKQQKLIPIRTISGSDLEHRYVNKYFEELQK
jgi:hypothetical protein